jgi:hypothetical protein
MKNQRPAGSAKPPARIPVAALNTDHLSALAAFERWQRESPHAGSLVQDRDSNTGPSASIETLKN